MFIGVIIFLCITLFNNREGFNMPTNTNYDCNDSPRYANDAPTYSTLSTDIGKPAMANFGVNVWKSAFHKSQNLFDKRYKPPQLTNMPNYPSRYSLTGEFMDDGPYASNS